MPEHAFADTWEPEPEPSAERYEVLTRLDALARDVRRAEFLRAAWERCAAIETPEAEHPRTPADVFTSYRADAEHLLTAVEFRRSPKATRALAHRLYDAYAHRGGLRELYRCMDDLPSRSAAIWTGYYRRSPSMDRVSFAQAIADIPTRNVPEIADAFVSTADDPIGVLDPDVRDDVLDAIADLPTPELRFEAAKRALVIDTNATLYRLDRYALSDRDEATLLRATARSAPDALAHYLPAIAVRDPEFARDLLDRVIRADLLAGFSAIEEFPFRQDERLVYEERAITSHPLDALIHRRDILGRLPSGFRTRALDVAFDALDHELPASPVDRLDALHRLVTDDGDIADRLAPRITRATDEALDLLGSEFHRLREEVARARGIAPADVFWSDDLIDLVGGEPAPYQRDDPEWPLINTFRQQLGDQRTRTLLVTAFSATVGECAIGYFSAPEIAPTDRRVCIERALASSAIAAPSDPHGETQPWHALAFSPRTEGEYALIRRYLDALAAASPSQYALVFSAVKFPIALLRLEAPRLVTLSPDNLVETLGYTGETGMESMILRHCDGYTAQQILDRVLSGDDAPANRAHVLKWIPTRLRTMAFPHIERWRRAGIAPYDGYPDAATVLRVVRYSQVRKIMDALPPNQRRREAIAFRAFLDRHGEAGERALWGLDSTALTSAMFPHPMLDTLDAILTEHPRILDEQPPQPRAHDAPPTVTRWDAIRPFIPYCPPDRLPELLGTWVPRARSAARGRRRTTDTTNLALLAFRLDRNELELARRLGDDPPIPIHTVARAPNPGRLLAFVEAHRAELAERFAAFGTARHRYEDYLTTHDDPEAAWTLLQRFADAYATMDPEDARRAAITDEFVLTDEHRRFSPLSGTLTYLTIGRREVYAATYAPLLRRLAHPEITDRGITLASLEVKELLAFIRDRLHDVLNESSDELQRADAENRVLARAIADGSYGLPEGTLLHATSLDALGAILREGNCCGETIGIQSRADSYPLFVDTLRIDGADAPYQFPHFATDQRYRYSGTRGVILCYPRRHGQSQRFAGEEFPVTTSGHERHHLSFIGIPRSELGAIVVPDGPKVEDAIAAARAAVIAGDVYVPIVDAHGRLRFAPEEFDAAYEDAKPYADLAALRADDAALDALDRPQPSGAHEFTLKRHLLVAENHARELLAARGIPDIWHEIVETAARLHDIGKFEAVRTGQELANVLAAEQELAKVRSLGLDTRNAILTLIRHDELLGDILKGMTLQPDGTIQLTPDAERRIGDFHHSFPQPIHRQLMRIVYEADVRAIGNGWYDRWQVGDKLTALEARLFPRT